MFLWAQGAQIESICEESQESKKTSRNNESGVRMPLFGIFTKSPTSFSYWMLLVYSCPPLSVVMLSIISVTCEFSYLKILNGKF